MPVSINFIFAKREFLASRIDIHSNRERRRRVGLKGGWDGNDAQHERADERRASLFAHVHIRMLFVLDIPWDPVTLDLYVHDETRVVRAGMSLRAMRTLGCPDLWRLAKDYSTLDEHFEICIFKQLII